MIKFVVVLSKRPDWSTEKFRNYLDTTHADFARKLPGLRRYVHNYVAADPKRNRPPWDAVVELYWDNKEAMEAAWASPEGESATADLDAFADLNRTSWSIVEELIVIQ